MAWSFLTCITVVENMANRAESIKDYKGQGIKAAQHLVRAIEYVLDSKILLGGI